MISRGHWRLAAGRVAFAVNAVRGRVRGVRGQALPIAVVALAVGAVLITPFLTGAGTDSRATGVVGIRAKERYSMDAGVEWSGWRLLSNPRITTDTSFNATVLQPFPATVNGSAFPQTEIRYVAGGGAVESQAPAWQGGGGDKCYTFSASEAGTLSARITVNSGQVWVALLAAAASCTRPGGLQPLWGASPYGADVTLPAAGTYQLLIGVDTATSGSLTMSVPAATYEVRSIVGSRNVIARLVAGYSGVRVSSWQLN
jgi:hypothetical protein